MNKINPNSPEPGPFNDNLLWLMRARHGRCPGCRAGELVAGPWGGISRNVFCSVCMMRWTFHAISHGIVSVTNEGECSPGEIDNARQRYTADQPFKMLHEFGLDDLAEYCDDIGNLVLDFTPDDTGLIVLLFNRKGDFTVISNLMEDDRPEVVRNLLEKMEQRAKERGAKT